MSNFTRTVLYIGVTNNIQARVAEHKRNKGSSFTSKYKCHYLLFFEEYFDINDAISREKNLKNWHREWKFNIIKEKNSDLKDLSEDWIDYGRKK